MIDGEDMRFWHLTRIDERFDEAAADRIDELGFRGSQALDAAELRQSGTGDPRIVGDRGFTIGTGPCPR